MPVSEFGVIHTTQGKLSSRHRWPAWLRKEIRDAGPGRRDGELVGEPKKGTMGAKRPRTTPTSDSKISEQVANRDDAVTDGEYWFEEDDD